MTQEAFVFPALRGCTCSKIVASLTYNTVRNIKMASTAQNATRTFSCLRIGGNASFQVIFAFNVGLGNLPIASMNFGLYPESRYDQEPFQTLLQHSKEDAPNPIDIYAVYDVEEKLFSTFRFIFITDVGFLQNTYSVLKPTNEFKLRKSELFKKSDEEEFTSVIDDPNFPQIEKIIEEENPSFSSDMIIDLFVRKDQSRDTYRVFLLEDDRGIIEI